MLTLLFITLKIPPQYIHFNNSNTVHVTMKCKETEKIHFLCRQNEGDFDAVLKTLFEKLIWRKVGTQRISSKLGIENGNVNNKKVL